MNTLSRGLGALLLAALALSGCSRHAAPTAQKAQRRTSEAALAVKPTHSQAGVAEKGAGMTEESESVADVAAGLSPIAAAVAASTAAAAAPIPSRWVEGKNYTTLLPAEPTSVDPSKVEVVEMFWYGCGHCFHLDPTLEEWRKKTKAPYVQFVRVPIMWNENTRAHARLYYAIEALGKVDALHTAVFNEIHVKGNPLVDPNPAATEKLQREFLKANGVTDAQFDNAYRSFKVEGQLQHAEDLMRRYHATGVPLMVVNGKYTADIGTAGPGLPAPEGETLLIQLVNDLAASERRH